MRSLRLASTYSQDRDIAHVSSFRSSRRNFEVLLRAAVCRDPAEYISKCHVVDLFQAEVPLDEPVQIG